jgi:transposase
MGADRAFDAARLRGAHRVDDRRIISGIVHMLRSGARWRTN